MKYLLVFALLLVLFVSCKEKTKEDCIKEAFKEYVNTDFDDPDDFCEITKIEAVDTFSSMDAKVVIVRLAEIQDMLSPQEVIKLADYAEKFDKDTTCIVTYLLNVRVKYGENKSLVNYYVIDNAGNMKVQDHLLNTYELPELYKGFFLFARDVLRGKI